MDNVVIAEYQDILSVGFFNKELCTRCGTCGGVCPVGAIDLSEDLFPVLNAEKCVKCGLCAKTCPGGAVAFQEISQSFFHTPYNGDKYTGQYIQSYIGCSTSQEIRENGSSGGLVTQLLIYLLESKTIDGAVVVSMDPENPTRGKAYIARSREELRPSQQSKYTIVPVNRVLAEIKKSDEKIALVGLPCQIHGLRKWILQQPRIAEKVPVVIGLYCVTNLEPTVTHDLLRISELEPKQISGFEFRGGKWPGQMRAIKKDGAPHPLHFSNFKDGAMNYLSRLYSPTRCQMCVDGSAEFADLSVADGWTRDGNGDYVYHRMSSVLSRTELGESILQNAQKAGHITLEPIDKKVIFDTHNGLQVHKKQNAPVRIARRFKQGQPVPQYDWNGANDLCMTAKIHEKTHAILTTTLGSHPKSRFLTLKLLLSKMALPLLWLRVLRKKYALSRKSKVVPVISTSSIPAMFSIDYLFEFIGNNIHTICFCCF